MRFLFCFVCLLMVWWLTGCTKVEPIMTDGTKKSVATMLNDQVLYHIPRIEGSSNFDGRLSSIGGDRKAIQVLNVWASWCSPCRDEAPEIAKFNQVKSNQVELIGVHAGLQDDLDEAFDFVNRYGWTFPQLSDSKGEIVKQLRAISYPTTLVLDQKGDVRWVHIGPVTSDQLQAVTTQLLEQANDAS